MVLPRVLVSGERRVPRIAKNKIKAPTSAWRGMWLNHWNTMHFMGAKLNWNRCIHIYVYIILYKLTIINSQFTTINNDSMILLWMFYYQKFSFFVGLSEFLPRKSNTSWSRFSAHFFPFRTTHMSIVNRTCVCTSAPGTRANLVGANYWTRSVQLTSCFMYLKIDTECMLCSFFRSFCRVGHAERIWKHQQL